MAGTSKNSRDRDAARRARLGAALRDNLKRRKTQFRERTNPASPASGDSAPTDDAADVGPDHKSDLT